MKDTQLYAQILGIEKPWQVSDVKVSLSNDEVEITVNHGFRPVDLPEVWKEKSGLRQANQALAPSRHLPVEDAVGGGGPARELRGTWGGHGSGSLVGVGQWVHSLV